MNLNAKDLQFSCKNKFRQKTKLKSKRVLVKQALQRTQVDWFLRAKRDSVLIIMRSAEFEYHGTDENKEILKK